MNKALLFGVLSIFLFTSCTKEEDPFEYPDNEVTEPTTVTHMSRSIADDEGWKAENSATGCDDDLNTIDFSFYDFSFTRGFATLHLKPDAASCDLYVASSSTIKSSELPSDYWKNWKMEFTFSELRLPEEAEVRFQFQYKDVYLDLDLAPHMREVFDIDSTFMDANGVFELNIDEGYNEFYLSGDLIQPDFSDGSGNTFQTGLNNNEYFVKVALDAAGTTDQTLLVFNYLLVTSFGVPESE